MKSPLNSLFLVWYTIADLRSAPDEELIARHDALATSTSVGVNNYLAELDRRDHSRAIEASHDLARAAYRLTVASTVLAAIAAVAAIVALLR